MIKDKQDILYNSHYLLNKSSGGYTLIELIISIAVFTIGIIGVLGLAVSNYYDAEDTIDRNIATNLAREGIELIRNTRDSNWLKIDANVLCNGNPCAWDSGLDGNQDYVYIDYGKFEPTFLACPGDPTNCIAANSETSLYFNADNYYYHDIASPPTGTLTKYSRVIKLSKICLNSNAEISQGDDPNTFEYLTAFMSTACDPGDSHIGLQILSHVQWQNQGTTDYVEIVDSIYNWRK